MTTVMCQEELNMNSNVVHIVSHPLIEHSLTILRDKEMGTAEFRKKCQYRV